MQFNDNIWYLPGNIDIRTCPKNGMTSVKNFFYKVILIVSKENYARMHKDFKPEKGGPSGFREWQAWNHADIYDFPFRKNSIKYAVKRDPVKRFLSGVEYLQIRIQREGAKQMWNRPYSKLYDNLSDVITDVEQQIVVDPHLLPQSLFLGNSDRYHHIYRLSELNTMFDSLCDHYKINRISMHLNKSSVKTITKNVKSSDIKRIKKIFEIDYDNGWY